MHPPHAYSPAYPPVRPRPRSERWRHALLITLAVGMSLGLLWSAVMTVIVLFFGFLFGNGIPRGFVGELFDDVGTAVLLPGPLLLTVATALITATGLLVSRRHPRRAAPFAVATWVVWAAFVVTWWVLFAVMWTAA